MVRKFQNARNGEHGQAAVEGVAMLMLVTIVLVAFMLMFIAVGQVVIHQMKVVFLTGGAARYAGTLPTSLSSDYLKTQVTDWVNVASAHAGMATPTTVKVTPDATNKQMVVTLEVPLSQRVVILPASLTSSDTEVASAPYYGTLHIAFCSSNNGGVGHNFAQFANGPIFTPWITVPTLEKSTAVGDSILYYGYDPKYINSSLQTDNNSDNFPETLYPTLN